MKIELRYLTRTAVLLGLTLAFQMLRLGQAFTGPAVNAMLYIATAMVGISSGVFIGLITPWIALIVGILKPVLAPAVPFIMAGNASLVIIFGLLQARNRYLAVAVASVVKYLILASAVRLILELPPPMTVALQLPQLFTALGGGVVALLVLRALAAIGMEPLAKR